MELRHLRYFVAVAEEENISRAAARLRISQPGVGRQIRDLEGELGLALLARTGKSVRLTAAGKIFFGEARDILMHVAAAVEKVRTSIASQAEINVGYLPSGTVGMLSRALRIFKAHFPEMRVTLHDLSAEDMQPLLLQRKLDVALSVLRHKLSPALDMQEVARYETCVAARTGCIRWQKQSSSILSRWRPNPLRPTPARIIRATTNTLKRCSPPWAASRASAASTTAAPA